MAAGSNNGNGRLDRGHGAEGLRLHLDLDVCAEARCPECAVECSYPLHPSNNGVLTIFERATHALVCRRCEEPHCVNACPRDALEQDKENGKLLVRHGMRCVACKACSHACPYGTIYPEVVPLITHSCDYCASRCHQAGEPRCAATCPKGALSMRPVQTPLPPDTFLVGKQLVVHSTHWDRVYA